MNDTQHGAAASAVARDPSQFYQAVLPCTGRYCLFLLGSKQHVWASSIDSLLDHTEARIDQQGVYFGTASFVEPTSRTQANVLALRSLRIDIDAGAAKFQKHPDGAYPTQRDALAAFIGASKDIALDPSYVVLSGEGLHVYYCLDEDLSPADWTPLAARLGEVLHEHNLKVDNTVTTDTARILRPIGALHPNGKRVSILKATGKVYGAEELWNLLGVTAEEPELPARKFNAIPNINADVTAAPVGPPKSIHKIIANCPAMAEVAAARGDVPEPHWRAMLGVVKFTVEGVDAAHELSSGHEDYDPSETEKKFEAWATGPTSCAEFAKHTTACAGCQYRGKVKSPVMVGISARLTEPPSTFTDASAQPTDLHGHVVPWDIATYVAKEHEFLFGEGRDGLAPLGSVSVIGAPGGHMKTALAVSWAVHVAGGVEWGGHKANAGAALLVQLEDDADECRRRVIATTKALIEAGLHDDVAARVQIVAMPGVDARFTRTVYGTSERTDMAPRTIAQAHRLLESCGLPVRLIVVDHARLAIGGDANDSSHVTELLRALSHVAKETGAAVLLLCHSPKSSLNPKHANEYSAVDVLGSGAFVDNARFAAVLTGLTEAECKDFATGPEVAKKHLAFRVIKSNYSEAGRVVYLRKTPVEGWGVAVPDVVTLAKPVRQPPPARPNRSAGSCLLALIRQHPGKFTKTSLRTTQSGKDGKLKMGEKAIGQALVSLITTGAVVPRAPTPEEIAAYGHGRQVKEVLHAV